MVEQAIDSQNEQVVVEEQIRQPEPPVNGFWWGTGRRKTSVARVRIREGKGRIYINGRRVEDYFKLERDQKSVYAPLKATGYEGRIDVIAKVEGGGFTGQAGAVVLGIARALVKMDPQTEDTLRDSGYLTRDPRMVERKKYGKRKARRSFQFSKR